MSIHVNTFTERSLIRTCISACFLRAMAPLTPDVLIHALPIYHISGLLVAGDVTFAACERILYMQKFDAERILAAMVVGDHDERRRWS
ncbi:hypothetical protein [Bradyrhizobium sp. WSM1253]|uniref:hypothetical protein n=1 Tax=Bradyrhizobium sp. WSM1253 TaxID=319003 RepID=UPI0012F4A123|nr:hypothetical protein [Bradyrhizobium sp. WSM1253]